MNEPPVIHDTFTIERRLPAAPARVFQAFADPEMKARWFAGPAGWTAIERKHEFRVGGKERAHGRFPDGNTSLFDALYLDIVPAARIVYVYEMSVNDRKISASLATIELHPDGDGTRLLVTEQGAFLHDPNAHTYAPQGPAKSRLDGTSWLMDKVVALFTS